MQNSLLQNRLLSHVISPDAIEATQHKIAERIKQQGEKPYVSVARQLDLLEKLTEFEFGRFLLQNQGVNGYWTHYMLTHPWHNRPTTELEGILLNRAPTLLATQQRFQIFLTENQKSVKNNAKLACIPCGMMGELLYLDYSKIDNINLTGFDYDHQALSDARSLAETQNLLNFVKLEQGDAWQMQYQNEFDLISSNGLNMYEPDDDRVEALYRNFNRALKPGGKLIISVLTPPPTMTDHCEWDFAEINQDDLLLQKIIFSDIIDAKW